MSLAPVHTDLPTDPKARTEALIAKAKKYFVPNYKPREMILDHGMEAKIWDLEGKKYIDLGSGIAVTSFGHHDQDMVNALITQAHKLWHTSNVFYTEPSILLAETLVEATPFARKVFFCNSGAEANEAAIKLARKYASLKHPPEKRDIVTFTGSFHGRTLATVTATAQPKYHAGFEPLPGGFVYCTPFNDEAAIEKLINERTCAVLVEPLQGEGGIMPAKPGFLKFVADLCRKHDALFMVDEVQCGVGRTGKLFCHMHEEGLEPDVMTLAKALGNGFPVGAMLVGERAMDVLQFGSHGTTFGGNPMACTIAELCIRKAMDPAVVANVERQGARLKQGLQEMNNRFQIFADVRGRGLMVGAELKQPWHGKAGDIQELARLNGVLILQAGPNVLRFLPPLTIADDELDEGLTALENALEQFLAAAPATPAASA